MSLDSLASQSKPKAPSKVQKRHSNRVRCRQAECRDSDGEAAGSVKYHEGVTTGSCHTQDSGPGRGQYCWVPAGTELEKGQPGKACALKQVGPLWGGGAEPTL